MSRALSFLSRILLILLLLLSLSSQSSPSSSALPSPSQADAVEQQQVTTQPIGAVILVVDGLGASYVYPEQKAHALDGSQIEGVVLFNLTGDGARALDVEVPVPETTKSHSVLITGDADTRPERPGKTIFDAARADGHLCIAILERGDSMPLLQEMDAVLYLPNNAMHGAEPIAGFRAGEELPQGLERLMQEWRDVFRLYNREKGVAGYAQYNAWAIDAACNIVRKLSGVPVLMLVNVGAVDSAGQNLGAEGYREVVSALDLPIGRLASVCKESGLILAVTADHGMVFPSLNGQGGHSAEKYSNRPEALRVPLVFLGPGIADVNLGGHWSETDIAPTIERLLNLSDDPFSGERTLPVSESLELRIFGAPAGLSIFRGEKSLASCIDGGVCRFSGLLRGRYLLRAGRETWEVQLNGDQVLDLTQRSGGDQALVDRALVDRTGLKKLFAVILILAINLTGAIMIIGIWKRG